MISIIQKLFYLFNVIDQGSNIFFILYIVYVFFSFSLLFYLGVCLLLFFVVVKIHPPISLPSRWKSL